MLSPISQSSPTPALAPPAILTAREREIADLIAYHAASNLEICQELQICEQTVKNHLTAVYRKLRLASRAKLTLYILRGGAL
jgi:two-component system, NarL family, nitrate/nitrite response regulator NarL